MLMHYIIFIYMLQLSHYLDIIEVQIARQVALKSEAFFRVMSSHEELQSRLAVSTQAILTLRGKVSYQQLIMWHDMNTQVLVRCKSAYIIIMSYSAKF